MLQCLRKYVQLEYILTLTINEWSISEELEGLLKVLELEITSLVTV